MRARLRRCWIAAHRWLGLGCGALLLFAALTGSLLVLAKPLDEAVHRQLFRTPVGEHVPLALVVQRLRHEFGPQATFVLRNLGRPGESLQASVTGPWQGIVYIDSASGLELGRRANHDGFFNLLFELHSTMYAGETGRALLTAAALAYVAMLLTGIVLWWPRRWRDALKIRPDGNTKLVLFDLHRVAGVTLGILVLLAVATGAYMAWRPLAGWVTQLSGQPPTRAPVLASTVPSASRPTTLDEALAQAVRQWPGASIGAVHVPAGSLGASRVRLKLPDDPHPVGMSSVWLDPRSGRVLAAHRWSELDPGSKAYSFIYPLHAGSLAGTGTLALTFLAGGALAFFVVTGCWLWWQRRGYGSIKSGAAKGYRTRYRQEGPAAPPQA